MKDAELKIKVVEVTSGDYVLSHTTTAPAGEFVIVSAKPISVTTCEHDPTLRRINMRLKGDFEPLPDDTGSSRSELAE